MTLVKHPTIPNVVEEVHHSAVKEWTDAGWVRVKKADEEAVTEEVEAARVAEQTNPQPATP